MKIIYSLILSLMLVGFFGCEVQDETPEADASNEETGEAGEAGEGEGDEDKEGESESVADAETTKEFLIRAFNRRDFVVVHDTSTDSVLVGQSGNWLFRYFAVASASKRRIADVVSNSDARKEAFCNSEAETFAGKLNNADILTSGAVFYNSGGAFINLFDDASSSMMAGDTRANDDVNVESISKDENGELKITLEFQENSEVGVKDGDSEDSDTPLQEYVDFVNSLKLEGACPVVEEAAAS